MNRIKVRILLLNVGFMLIGIAAYALDCPPDCNPPPPPPPVGLPIDGGLSLLLASGVAYGIYALKRKK